MQSGWFESHNLAHTAQDVPPTVTTAAYDRHQELVWLGNAQGAVLSYLAPDLAKYTSWLAHHQAPSVRVLPQRHGIASVAPGSVRVYDRGGVMQLSYADQALDGARAAAYANHDYSHIAVAGDGSDIVVVDLHRGEPVTQTALPSGASSLARSSRYLVVGGGEAGRVSLLDPASLRIEQTVTAHMGPITSVDVQGTMLITTGLTPRRGQFIVEQFINVYDVRAMPRPLPRIALVDGPTIARFHGRFTNQVWAVTQSNALHSCDLQTSMPDASWYQLDCQPGDVITCFDVSSTADLLVFGDSGGGVHQWAAGEGVTVNLRSTPTDVVAIGPPEPSEDQIVPTDDPDYDIPPIDPSLMLQQSQHSLLSTWPSGLPCVVGLPPVEIEPEVLATMQMHEFVGYARNVTKRLRNVAQQGAGGASLGAVDAAARKLKHERKKLLIKSGASAAGGTGAGDAATTPVSASAGATPVPSKYQLLQIKYGRFGSSTFDFRKYNPTYFGGLENTLPNSYIIPGLYLLYFLPAVRAALESHICRTEFCVSCELGFLFHMLDKSCGEPCEAANLLRAFRQMQQVQALGLLEMPDHLSTTTLPQQMETFLRFLLERLKVDLQAAEQRPKATLTLADKLPESLVPKNPKSSAVVDALLGMSFESVTACSVCAVRTARTTRSFSLELEYPSEFDASVCFQDLLRGKFHQRKQQRVWCSGCKAYQPLQQTRRLIEQPAAMVIHCALKNEADFHFWLQNCGRHNPFSSVAGPDGADAESWLPFALAIGRQRETGDFEVIKHRYNNDNDDDDKYNQVVRYSLFAVISEVSNLAAQGARGDHLVAHIRVPDVYHAEKRSRKQNTGVADDDRAGGPGAWYLFNDFGIQATPRAEVAYFAAWKMPVALCYLRDDVDAAVPVPPIAVPSGRDLLLHDPGVALPRRNTPAAPTYTPLLEDELPRKGQLFAIDAEFVSLSEEEMRVAPDGSFVTSRPATLAPARISVLRGDGPREGTACIDDYTVTSEPIVDYLTRYSGISPGDLDPATTRHHLTTLKSTYLKLRYILDCGAVFVGHGLNQDFRTLNMLVPKDQVRDTVELFRMKSGRKVSLRFLGQFFFHADIQATTHDSIQDARMALRLYRQWQKLDAAGQLQATLDRINTVGRETGWQIDALAARQLQQQQ